MSFQITLAGLAIQLASFIFFTVTLLVFGFRLLRRDAYRSPPQPFSFVGYKFWSNKLEYDWRPAFFVLALTCIGILIRSVFRLIEFSQGQPRLFFAYCCDAYGLLFGPELLLTILIR